MSRSELKRGDIVVYEPDATQKFTNPQYKGCIGIVVASDPTCGNAYGQPSAHVYWLHPPVESNESTGTLHHVAANLRKLGDVPV